MSQEAPSNRRRYRLRLFFLPQLHGFRCSDHTLPDFPQQGPERSYSLGLNPGSKLVLCIEVPRPERPGRGGDMGGGGRSGGMSGPPAGMSRSEAIEYWYRIELNGSSVFRVSSEP